MYINILDRLLIVLLCVLVNNTQYDGYVAMLELVVQLSDGTIYILIGSYSTCVPYFQPALLVVLYHHIVYVLDGNRKL